MLVSGHSICWSVFPYSEFMFNALFTVFQGIGEGSESPWTAPRPKFLITSDPNFPQDDSQQPQPGNFHSAPTSPFSTLPPPSRGGGGGGHAYPLDRSPFNPTATLGLDQQQLEDLVGSQWSLRYRCECLRFVRCVFVFGVSNVGMFLDSGRRWER